MAEAPAVERPSYNSCDSALEPRGEWVEKTNGKLMRKHVEEKVADREAVKLRPYREEQTNARNWIERSLRLGVPGGGQVTGCERADGVNHAGNAQWEAPLLLELGELRFSPFPFLLDCTEASVRSAKYAEHDRPHFTSNHRCSETTTASRRGKVPRSGHHFTSYF